MQTSIFENDDSMPATVKNAAAKELPSFLESDDDSTLATDAKFIASAFGDDGSFSSVVTAKNAARNEAEKRLVQSFQKNTELLVQKTWVDKADEALKEEIFFRIDTLSKNLSRYDYHASLSDFLPVLHDVVYLLFGSLSKSDSFLEYAVRIDPDFGFFWYYINSLSSWETWSEEKCRLAVLLGICFLSNF